MLLCKLYIVEFLFRADFIKSEAGRRHKPPFHFSSSLPQIGRHQIHREKYMFTYMYTQIEIHTQKEIHTHIEIHTEIEMHAHIKIH